MLRVHHTLPEGLLAQAPHQLWEHLGGPTLIHLPGRHPEPLFVSVLLHGNEPAGWLALRQVLSQYQHQSLPRALSILIGNVEAAAHNLRHLSHQPDYNRIWNAGDTPEHAMARQVQEAMSARQVFAAIDIHNNTGRNPHYACVNRLDHRFFHLARLFSRTVVYFQNPDSVLSIAFARLCPAITVECGQAHEPHGVTHAAELIESGLRLSEHPAHPIAHQDIDLLHTMAVVKIPQTISLAVDNPEAALSLNDDLDQLNFCELPPGTVLGQCTHAEPLPIHAWNDQQHDVASRFFRVHQGRLLTTVTTMPAMLTLRTDIIRQDCLCYLMERLPLPSA